MNRVNSEILQLTRSSFNMVNVVGNIECNKVYCVSLYPCYEPALTVLVGQPPNNQVCIPEPEQATTQRFHCFDISSTRRNGKHVRKARPLSKKKLE